MIGRIWSVVVFSFFINCYSDSCVFFSIIVDRMVIRILILVVKVGEYFRMRVMMMLMIGSRKIYLVLNVFFVEGILFVEG